MRTIYLIQHTLHDHYPTFHELDVDTEGPKTFTASGRPDSPSAFIYRRRLAKDDPNVFTDRTTAVTRYRTLGEEWLSKAQHDVFTLQRVLSNLR